MDRSESGREVESEKGDVPRQRVRFIAGRRPAILYASMSAFLALQFGCARPHNTNPICIGIDAWYVWFVEK